MTRALAPEVASRELAQLAVEERHQLRDRRPVAGRRARASISVAWALPVGSIPLPATAALPLHPEASFSAVPMEGARQELERSSSESVSPVGPAEDRQCPRT